jgi:GNAT superfamily N-acetyltransferase
MPAAPLTILPLTPDRWSDLEALFGKQGAYSGCWCMWWRLAGRDYGNAGAAGRKAAFAEIVAEGREPGLLAYADGVPVGWCAIAPRSAFPRFDRSRYWQPVDDRPVWSLNCFFIARGERGRGVATALLRAALDFARERGARLIEAYPKEAEDGTAAAALYTGTVGMFRAAGFTEVARRHRQRPIMRLALPVTIDDRPQIGDKI